MLTRISFALFILFLSGLAFNSALLGAEEALPVSTGQKIYVPAYSHINVHGERNAFQLTIVLSVRNIDPDHQIQISAVDYYSTPGNRLSSFVEQPVMIKPLDTLSFVVPEKDTRGGLGANFIVDWTSNNPVNPPIAESIMTGSRGTQAFSFVSRGRAIHSNR